MDLVSVMEMIAATTAAAEEGKSKGVFPAGVQESQTKCHNSKQGMLINILFTVATTVMDKDQQFAPPVGESNSFLSTSTLP